MMKQRGLALLCVLMLALHFAPVQAEENFLRPPAGAAPSAETTAPSAGAAPSAETTAPSAETTAPSTGAAPYAPGSVSEALFAEAFDSGKVVCADFSMNVSGLGGLLEGEEAAAVEAEAPYPLRRRQDGSGARDDRPPRQGKSS